MNSLLPQTIRSTRLSANLTQRESAEMIGVTHGMWAKYEYGTHKMKSSMWELYNLKIANVGKFDYTELPK